MKKTFAIILALILAFGTAGCGWAEETEPIWDPAEAGTEMPEADTEADIEDEEEDDDTEDDEDEDVPEDDSEYSEADGEEADEGDTEDDEDIEYEITLDPEDGSELTGKWYGMANSMTIILDLKADGNYEIQFAGERKEGSWTYEDGIVILDGEEGIELPLMGDALVWDDELLSREEDPDDRYIPADVLTGDRVAQEDFNGYWISWYVIVNGEAVRSDELGDVTDIYVEDGKAALGGDIFGDVAVDMTYSDGALIFAAGEVTLTLQLQEDDFMRMILSGISEGDLIIYLLPEEDPEE